METDYLVVGAGASGMAFADALVAASDADVLLVDRRHAPGGHWNDAYPFVRLHAPSAFYGVNSRMLGHDGIDDHGVNAGGYERATGTEVRDYYRQVLDDLVAGGRVRFLGTTEYVGAAGDQHVLRSCLSGEASTVRVRRRVVDATYLEPTLPSTHTPGFAVDPDVRLVTPNDLVRLDEPTDGFTVLGSGKTAMDTCVWLLEQGVDPDRIRWVRPRDAWLQNRAYLQPRDLVASFMEGLARQFEVAAVAADAAALWRGFEETDQFLRLDRGVEPTMYRGATASDAEVDLLRSVERVVRLGRVRRLRADQIELEHGNVASGAGHVHVDCTASGVSTAPARTVFEEGRVTLQSVQTGNICFSAALIGHVEAAVEDEAERNRLCPPNPYLTTPQGWIPAMLITQRARIAWQQHDVLREWLRAARLDITYGVERHLGDPQLQSAVQRFLTNLPAALATLERLTRAPAVPA